jgi:hypothetical protein
MHIAWPVTDFQIDLSVPKIETKWPHVLGQWQCSRHALCRCQVHTFARTPTILTNCFPCSPPHTTPDKYQNITPITALLLPSKSISFHQLPIIQCYINTGAPLNNALVHARTHARTNTDRDRDKIWHNLFECYLFLPIFFQYLFIYLSIYLFISVPISLLFFISETELKHWLLALQPFIRVRSGGRNLITPLA